MLRIENLFTSFDHTFFLRDISFEINQGEVVLLTGKNGAGKSTLMKTIVGLLKNQKGHIFFNDKILDNLPPDERIKLGISFVFQDKRLFMRLTVEENLITAIYNGNNKYKATEFIYSVFPLLEIKRKVLAGNLSGGEQEILAIARAFIQNPKLLLLDEPSAGLTFEKIDSLKELMNIFIEKNNSILLVEHKSDYFKDILTKNIQLIDGQMKQY